MKQKHRLGALPTKLGEDKLRSRRLETSGVSLSRKSNGHWMQSVGRAWVGRGSDNRSHGSSKVFQIDTGGTNVPLYLQRYHSLNTQQASYINYKVCSTSSYLSSLKSFCAGTIALIASLLIIFPFFFVILVSNCNF